MSYTHPFVFSLYASLRFSKRQSFQATAFNLGPFCKGLQTYSQQRHRKLWLFPHGYFFLATLRPCCQVIPFLPSYASLSEFRRLYLLRDEKICFYIELMRFYPNIVRQYFDKKNHIQFEKRILWAVNFKWRNRIKILNEICYHLFTSRI